MYEPVSGRVIETSRYNPVQENQRRQQQPDVERACVFVWSSRVTCDRKLFWLDDNETNVMIMAPYRAHYAWHALKCYRDMNV